MGNFEKGLAVLGGALAGAFGGGSDNKGSQGYTGGIPELTAQREQVPGAFDPTGRRPGEAGRRYFTDVQYTPKTNAEGIQTVMGGDYLAQLNANALARQQQQQEQGLGLLSLFTGVGVDELPDYFKNRGITKTISDPQTPQTPTGPTDAEISTAVKGIKEQYGMTPAGYERMIKAMTNYGVSPDRLAGIIGVPVDTIRGYVNDYYNKTGVFAPTPKLPELDVEPPIISDPVEAFEDKPVDNFSSPPDVKEPQVSDAQIRKAVETVQAGTGTNQEKYERVIKAMVNNNISPERVSEVMGIPLSNVQRVYDKYKNFAGGGLASLGKGYYLGGSTDGMADKVPATIDGAEPARLSDGEFVVPADVVSHLGNGNSDAGAKQLYSMMDRVRKARTGTTKQGTEINPRKYLG